MQRRRVSRPLLAGLVVVIVLGLFFYLHNVSRTRAAERAERLARDAQAKADAHISEVVKASSEPAPMTPPPATPSAPKHAPSQDSPLVTSTPPLTTEAIAFAGSHPAASPAPAIPIANVTPAAAAPVAVAPLPLSGTPMADAKAKKDSGDLLAARDILNAALLSGHLSEADASTARANLSEINQTVFFSPKRFADNWTEGYQVQSGERLASIAARHSVTWQLLSRINGVDPKRLRSGVTIKAIKGPLHAVVTKSKFRMDLYLGSPGEAGAMFVTSFPVGLGKNESTPTGTWHVQPGNKILHPRYYSPRGEGVIEAEDPKNPLGGYWIGLEGLEGQAMGKNSYGIHGTIDPDSIGKQASMGCIRLRHDDIEMVFEMLVEDKSKIIVNP